MGAGKSDRAPRRIQYTLRLILYLDLHLPVNQIWFQMATITASTTIVLITGANQGIGLAIARVLSTPAIYPDQHVIIGSRSPTKGEEAIAVLLEEDATRSLSTIIIDLASDASISAAAAVVVDRFGHLDVLINNAGNELILFIFT